MTKLYARRTYKCSSLTGYPITQNSFLLGPSYVGASHPFQWSMGTKPVSEMSSSFSCRREQKKFNLQVTLNHTLKNSTRVLVH